MCGGVGCGLLCRVIDGVLPLLFPETLIGESLEMDEEDWRESPYVHLLHSTAPRVFTVRTVPVQCVCVCGVGVWAVRQHYNTMTNDFIV